MNRAGPETDAAKGAILRLFGAVLIILATLNAMLSWRGGFAVGPVAVWMLGAGAALFAVGALRRPPPEPPANRRNET